MGVEEGCLGERVPVEQPSLCGAISMSHNGADWWRVALDRAESEMT